MILHLIASVLFDMFVDLLISFKQKECPRLKDLVHAYASEVLSLGVLYAEFQDSIQEGDGLCVLLSWHYFLSIFRASIRTNCSIS